VRSNESVTRLLFRFAWAADPPSAKPTSTPQAFMWNVEMSTSSVQLGLLPSGSPSEAATIARATLHSSSLCSPSCGFPVTRDFRQIVIWLLIFIGLSENAERPARA
jgi:hypothetical protein